MPNYLDIIKNKKYEVHNNFQGILFTGPITTRKTKEKHLPGLLGRFDSIPHDLQTPRRFARLQFLRE